MPKSGPNNEAIQEKIRIGVAAGPGVVDDQKGFIGLVDALDDLGYDSIWVPDVVTTSTLDPISALSFAAGRRQRLKLGTHLILPGRDPVFLAKQLATLDRLSGGRLLLLAVLGLRQPAELAAQGVDGSQRSKMLEESLEIMRGLWTGEPVTFQGDHYHYSHVQLTMTPRQRPLEVWLGRQVPAALRRCGRIGEGWMPGLCTPAEASEAMSTIHCEAKAVGRTIDSGHFGINISWTDGAISDAVAAGVRARRPDLDPNVVIAKGQAGLSDRIEAFTDVGFSKFVIRPAEPPASWPQAVESVADVLTLQT